MKEKLLLLLIINLISIPIFSQKDSTQQKDRYAKSLAFFYQAGNVIQTNDFVKGDNASGKPIDYYQSFGLKYGIETDGRKFWQQNWNYPVWGFGVYAANFFNQAELGTPSAIYAFFNAPFKRYRKWSINYRAKFGFSYDWKPFDPETNAFNYAIGSYNTVFVDVGIYANFKLWKRFDLGVGYALSHFSNGATRVPNLGLNLAAPFFEVKYRFRDREEFKVQERPEHVKSWEFLGLLALSQKQMAFDTSSTEEYTGFVAQDYAIVTFSTTANYLLSHKVKLGAGLDFGYDEAYNSYIHYDGQNVTPKNAATGDKFSLGVYASFELVINKVSVVAQPGWYLYREEFAIPKPHEEENAIEPSYTPGTSYQRIGLKWHVWNDLFVGFNVRAYNFSIADYLEWNFGYRIKSKSKR